VEGFPDKINASMSTPKNKIKVSKEIFQEYVPNMLIQSKTNDKIISKSNVNIEFNKIKKHED